jgi:cytochrome c
LTIKVGNTLPDVAISTEENSTFFKANSGNLKYAVDVKDKKDKMIDPSV